MTGSAVAVRENGSIPDVRFAHKRLSTSTKWREDEEEAENRTLFFVSAAKRIEDLFSLAGKGPTLLLD